MISKWFYFSAPGSYEVERAEKTIHQSSSAYSFGIKYKEERTENLPGNNYKNAIHLFTFF